ncbi:hypothetical protein TNCV_4716741, partial [Trichonephila clavipes]
MRDPNYHQPAIQYETPTSSPSGKQISARPRTFPQRLAQPISFLLLAKHDNIMVRSNINIPDMDGVLLRRAYAQLLHRR